MRSFLVYLVYLVPSLGFWIGWGRFIWSIPPESVRNTVS
jgi:hypothetical protein